MLVQLTWAGIGARIERKIDLTFNDVSVVSMRTICTVLGSGEVVSRSVSNQRIDERCRGRYTVAYVLISCLSLQEWRVFSHPCSCRMCWVVAKDTVFLKYVFHW